MNTSPFVICGVVALLACFSADVFGQGAIVDGQVTKIDQSGGKITIKHGPIKNLDMDGMTMAFRAKDPAMLRAVKAGDKIKFEADKINGQYTVTKIEKAQ